jgi:dienelactone hydrolase
MAVDAGGVTWRSQATYRTDTRGVVDLTHAAPVEGSYSGVEPMGLFWSMMPVSGRTAPSSFVYSATGFDATLQVVRASKVVVSRVVHRSAVAAGIRQVDERLADVGFYGEYYAPEVSSARPAIVVVGGSEGGLAVTGIARLLASRGYPCLALAYFDEPGLPSGVTAIPLEYFAHAIEWVSRQPGVDPSHVYLAGISRGAEAALLVASHYPGLLHGVIAAAPTSVVNPPEPLSNSPAWTFDGVGLPGISPADFGEPNPPDAQAAVIPVQQIGVPLLMICGTADDAWPSCPYADAIEQRRSRGQAATDVVVRVPDAGHGVASLVPYISEASTVVFGGENFGGSPLADGAGRALAWAALLGFMAS